jgi:hypothetical protein
MTINLPKLNQTGKNEWADVEDNDVALKEAIESVETEVAAISGLTWYTPKVIATEQSRESAEFGFLTTEDKIENVVLPENGLIGVVYHAHWKTTGGGTAEIYLGSNAIKTVNNETGSVTTTNAQATAQEGFKILASDPAGLRSMASGELGNNVSADVTTGQTVGAIPSLSSTVGGFGSLCLIEAAAGTYTVGIKFACTAGKKVTVKERKLRVLTLG